MTKLSAAGNEHQSFEGRSVRDVVEYSPELVNETWCRKIFRQILQSLDRQYAMQMPHRIITPDTIVFHESGEPLLAPAVVDDGPSHSEADDLRALAGVIHYAITGDLVPGGPLRGRAPAGYSDSLINAVDRCMATDPAERPHDITTLRELLGMVTVIPATSARFEFAHADAQAADPAHAATSAPASAAVSASASAPVSAPASAPASAAVSTLASAPVSVSTAAPASMPAAPTAGAPINLAPPSTVSVAPPMPSFAAPRPGLSRRQRWAIVAGGGAALAALALVMFAEMRDSGSFDHIVLSLPQRADNAAPDGAAAAAAANPPAQAAVTPGPAQETTPAATSSVAAAPSVTAAAATPGPQGAAAPDAGAAPLEAAAPAVALAHPAQAARSGSANYRLRIQPWGVVYVDGVDRGVSPPVKRLSLPPGKHTLRITNPAFEERVLEVDTTLGDAQVAVDFNVSH